jgi:hypothetical protein
MSVTIEIDGSEVHYVNDSISINAALGMQPTIGFIVDDDDGSEHYNKGQRYEILQDGVPVVAGVIDQSEEQFCGPTSSALLHSVTALDNTYYASKRIFAASYQNTIAGAIALAIFTQCLEPEGCTIGKIEDGGAIAEAIFNYQYAADCLNTLAAKTDFCWWIDKTKKFYFIGKTSNQAPWDLTAEDIDGIPEIERGHIKYRNKQYILDGKDITSVQTEIRAGDGQTQTFVLNYPMALVPVISISLNGAPFIEQSVGIKDVDVGKQWYWNKNSNIIAQDVGQQVLNSIDKVKCEYQGYYDIVVVIADSEAISNMQARDGGTGIVEAVAHKPEAGSLAAGVEFANEELRKNAIDDGFTMRFDTRRSGLMPGQQILNKTRHGTYNVNVLITEINTTVHRHGLLHSVTAVYGFAYEPWVNFFVKMFHANEPVVIKDNISEQEFLRLVTSYSKTWIETDTPNIFFELNLSEVLYLSETLYFMFAYTERVKYVAALDVDGNEIGRKVATYQSGQTGNRIDSRFFITQTEFVGNIVSLAWYGGNSATDVAESGIKIDEQAYVHTKTSLETLQIQRIDIKGW